VGHNPKWQAFGYDPKYSGFQPRPSVLRAPQLPVQVHNGTDTGDSTVYQKPGNAEITVQPGPTAQSADQQAAFFPVSDLPVA
jgi:hypothetical protein